METFRIIDDSIQISDSGTVSLYFVYVDNEGVEYGEHQIYDDHTQDTGVTASGHWIDFPPSMGNVPVDMDFIHAQLQGSADDFFSKRTNSASLQEIANEYNSQL